MEPDLPPPAANPAEPPHAPPPVPASVDVIQVPEYAPSSEDLSIAPELPSKPNVTITLAGKAVTLHQVGAAALGLVVLIVVVVVSQSGDNPPLSPVPVVPSPVSNPTYQQQPPPPPLDVDTVNPPTRPPPPSRPPPPPPPSPTRPPPPPLDGRCSEVQAPALGSVTYSNNRMAPSVATFSCPRGLHLIGPPTLRCDVAGNWELSPAHRCSTKWTSSFGNEIVDRQTPDGAANIQFVDTSLAFSDVGRVTAYDIYTGRAGTQAIQIWRPIDPVAGTYTLLCENIITASTAGVDFHFQLPRDDHCLVGPGDVLGWYHQGQGVTDFDSGELGHDDVKWHCEAFQHPSCCKPDHMTTIGYSLTRLCCYVTGQMAITLELGEQLRSTEADLGSILFGRRLSIVPTAQYQPYQSWRRTLRRT